MRHRLHWFIQIRVLMKEENRDEDRRAPRLHFPKGHEPHDTLYLYMAGVTRKGAGADIRDRRTFSQQSDGLWNFVVCGCRFAVWSEGSIILTTILPKPIRIMSLQVELRTRNL